MSVTAPIASQGDLSRADLVERVVELRNQHSATLPERTRIRAVLDGGPDGMRALLGDKIKGIGSDIPAPNLIASAMEHLAQKLSDTPILRADPPARVRDENVAQEKAEKRERIVENYDEICKLDLQLPYIARWLIGYGYAAWVIRDWKSPDGHRYPFAELRDPWDIYPGYWGPSHEPADLAAIRRVPARAMAAIFPEYAERLLSGGRPAGQWSGGGLVLDPTRGSSENPAGAGLEVIEYYNAEGTWIYVPEKDLLVDYQPNP
ncbi:MAG: hypothetical protein NUV49_00290, partial [Patescibacteria group bacterium]|nr:hypothetical protein [Patescibacteria group bacterium]